MARLGLFVVICAGAVAIGRLPAGTRAGPYLLVHLGLSWLMVRTLHSRAEEDPGALRWSYAAAVFGRLVLLAAPAYTSNDVERYLWDGFVASQGEDPYLHAPADAYLEPLRRVFPAPRDNASYPTLYPPAAVALFSAVARLGPGAGRIAFALVLLASQLLLLEVTRRTLKRVGSSHQFCLVALSPLLALEGGVGLHLDVVVALAVAVALSLSMRAAHFSAGIALGLGAALKLLPGLCALPGLGLLGRRSLRTFAGLAFAVSAAYAAALLVGLRPWGSVNLFFSLWHFGSPAYALLVSIAGGENAALLSRLAMLLCLAALCRSSVDAGPRAMLLAMAIPLALGPVTFPWYLCALVPAVAVRPGEVWLAWLTFAPLTYEVLDRYQVGQGWAPRGWPLLAVAVAVALAGLGERSGSLAARLWVEHPRGERDVLPGEGQDPPRPTR